jgi:hypothetical protein
MPLQAYDKYVKCLKYACHILGIFVKNILRVLHTALTMIINIDIAMVTYQTDGRKP